MDVLQLIGRVVFGGFFILNGLHHLTSWGSLTRYARSKGVPSPGVAVVASGFMLLAGGLSVVFGVLVNVGLLVLIAFLVPVSLIMHDFWAVPEERRAAQRAQFLKNLALAGAALMLYWSALQHPWPYSLGG